MSMSMSMSMSMHTSIDRGGAFSGRRAEGKSPEKRTDTCQSACSHRCAPRGREGRRGRRNGAQSARAPPKGVSEKRALCSRSAATSRTHPAPQHVPSAKRGVSRPWKMRPGVALHHAEAVAAAHGDLRRRAAVVVHPDDLGVSSTFYCKGRYFLPMDHVVSQTEWVARLRRGATTNLPLRHAQMYHDDTAFLPAPMPSHPTRWGRGLGGVDRRGSAAAGRGDRRAWGVRRSPCSSGRLLVGPGHPKEGLSGRLQAPP